MEYYVSNDRNKLQINRVKEMLNKTYWAANRSEKVIKESINNSLCYGVYECDTDKLIGFARVITDYATTYYLCDVVVDDAYRGKGVGKALLTEIVSDTRFDGLKALLLTRDAHGFYKHFGFEEDAKRLMWKNNV